MLDQATIDAANAAAMPRAMAELERRQRERSGMPLVDFVAANTTGYSKPVHLSDYTADLDATEQGSRFIAVTAPPRHGKTETTLAGCARLLRRNPRLRIAYAAYSALVSFERSKLCAEMARRAGVRMGGRQKAALWRTAEGGCFFATSVNGSFTSFGFDLIIVDDPHKDRAEAESPNKRGRVHDWFSSTARSRLEPGGSIVATHTRWHPDDLIGHLLSVDAKLPEARRKWTRYHKYAARYADADGVVRALWPERYPLDVLQGIEDTTTAYDWWSLYMSEPRPRGDRVFEGTYFYDWNARPKEGVRYAIGVDLAYTASTQSDHSVAVVMAESKGKYYVLKVVRRQCAAPAFAEELKKLAVEFPAARMRAYAYGPEKGSIDFMRKMGLPRLVGLQASGDKFVRAQPVAAAWNKGHVMLPELRSELDVALEETRKIKGAELEAELQRIIDDSPDLQEAQAEQGERKPAGTFPWVNDFATEVNAFTGVHDPSDDQVDAMAAAYDLLYRGAGGRPPSAGRGKAAAVTPYVSPFSM